MLILRQMLRALPVRASGRPALGRLHCQGCAERFRPPEPPRSEGGAPPARPPADLLAAPAPSAGCPIGLPVSSSPQRGPETAAADGYCGATTLNIEFARRDDGRTVARLTGEVDLVTACELHFRLQDKVAEDPRLVLDVTGLGFIDALGIRILLQAAELAEQGGGRLPLVGARPQLLSLISILRIQGRLPVFDTVEEAIQACDKGHGIEPLNELLLLSKTSTSQGAQSR